MEDKMIDHIWKGGGKNNHQRARARARTRTNKKDRKRTKAVAKEMQSILPGVNSS
jgi:hypothetical protein